MSFMFEIGVAKGCHRIGRVLEVSKIGKIQPGRGFDFLKYPPHRVLLI